MQRSACVVVILMLLNCCGSWSCSHTQPPAPPPLPPTPTPTPPPPLPPPHTSAHLPSSHASKTFEARTRSACQHRVVLRWPTAPVTSVAGMRCHWLVCASLNHPHASHVSTVCVHPAVKLLQSPSDTWHVNSKETVDWEVASGLRAIAGTLYGVTYLRIFMIVWALKGYLGDNKSRPPPFMICGCKGKPPATCELFDVLTLFINV